MKHPETHCDCPSSATLVREWIEFIIAAVAAVAADDG
jgi:hypothetical protein